MVKRARSAIAQSHSLTMRQNQIVHLVAAGLTNKEIGHLLGITPRGVSAHVSRLLLAFSVTNRAELVARALMERNGQERTDPLSESAAVSATLESELLAYRDAPVVVVLTIGEKQTIWFVNQAAERALGMDYAEAVGRSLRECLKDPSAAWWIEEVAGTLRTGLPRSISAPADFTCVFQPVLIHDAVAAVLTICMTR